MFSDYSTIQHKVSTQAVSRLVAISDLLSRKDFSRVPFDGFNKHKKEKFRYSVNEVALPEYMYYYGADPGILNGDLTIAFGGTVSPVEEGFKLAQYLACLTVKLLTNKREVIVVSGGAFGIDMAAHLGTLDAGGKTVAVVVHPSQLGTRSALPVNTFLTEGILGYGGGIVCESNDEITTISNYADRLQKRDRIISALSDIFIAIECKKDSGTVDTAKRAIIQGKRVYAIDWDKIARITHTPSVSGLNQLIQEGVALAFPQSPVKSLLDDSLTQQFNRLLNNHL